MDSLSETSSSTAALVRVSPKRIKTLGSEPDKISVGRTTNTLQD